MEGEGNPAAVEQAGKAGRPAGSVSADPLTVRAVRPACRRCGSSNLVRRAVMNDIAHRVAHHDGTTTSRRRWQRAMCRDCGQWQTIIEDYAAGVEKATNGKKH